MAVATARRSARAGEYDRLGFHVERGLLAGEVGGIVDAFMRMHAGGGVKGHYEPFPAGHNDGFHHSFGQGDPLAVYPRVMHPHRFMPLSMRYLLDPRIMDVLEDLAGEEVLAAQSMFYFKPAGARGQAWHQDNFYLQVRPGTCLAAWIACDRCDRDNGALQVVVRTHTMDVVCPTRSADPNISFTRELVTIEQILQTRGVSYGTDAAPVPKEVEVAMPVLEAGDVLFFNGSLVHGSGPNGTKDRFRRSLINHYVPASCLEVASHYHPLLDRRGREVGRALATGGGPCGTEHFEAH
jgi:hypothetical protein